MFAGAVTFGGADVQPPLAGLAVVAGGNFAVVLARPGAAEVWRVGPAGRIGTDAVVFPSAIGQMGAVSTVSTGGSLYATYADCSAVPSPSCTDGQRFFLKIACF